MRMEPKLQVDYGFSRIQILHFPNETVVLDTGRCVGPGMTDTVTEICRQGVDTIEDVRKVGRGMEGDRTQWCKGLQRNNNTGRVK